VINTSLSHAIEQQWVNDKNRLIRKSQTLKNKSIEDDSNKKILGKRKYMNDNKNNDKNTQNGVNNDSRYDSEIYDDLDMYEYMLHQIIQNGSSTILNSTTTTADDATATRPHHHRMNGITTAALNPLPHMYHSYKRPIERRATKGRKIKYVVIPKLVNFMAPLTRRVDADDSTVYSTDQLFRNLFGRSKRS